MSESRASVDGFGAELTVGAVTRHFARIAPGKQAVRDKLRSLTYGELDARADGLATALVRRGIGGADVVCAFLPNCMEYVLVVLAVARSGAIFSPINPRFKTFELSGILEQARPRLVFTTRAHDGLVRECLEAVGQHDTIFVHVDADGSTDRATSLAALLAQAPGALPPVSENDFFSLMFTAGTTGQPKGALGIHRARMLWVLNAIIEYGLSERDVYLGTMPQVHSAGLTFALMHLYAGATVRIQPEFDADEFIDIVQREAVTSALTVPTMLSMILEATDRGHAADAFSTLRRLVTCGSPLPLATKKRVLRQVTRELYDYYGSTESNSMTVLRPAEQLRKSESVGRAFRNVELMIADAEGGACATRVVGEVWCANPSAFTAYRDRPHDTERAFTGKWFHTGDLGFLDEEGFLHLVGRRNDVVISGGFNVYPAEIERVLMLHPSVLDAAVVGVPDPIWGESVKAYVVLRPGERLEADDVQRHCCAHLADFKKPRAVAFVASLPKNAAGKTVKSALPEHTHD